jgi:hypothetical protein
MTSSDRQNTTQIQTEQHKTTITVGEFQVLRNGKDFCFTSGTRPVFYPLSGWFLHRWS